LHNLDKAAIIPSSFTLKKSKGKDMRKAIIISCTLGSLLIILGQFGFFDALLLFFLAGIVPGTTYSIPSSIMYSLIVIGFSLVILSFIGIQVLDFFHTQANKLLASDKKASTQKKRLPKRRYSQI
jgi:hypothetical protein